MFLEMQTLDLPLEGSFQLALADDQKARVRDALQHEGRRVDEVALPFVWDERCHIADNRRLVREPELLVHVQRRRSTDALEVDPVIDEDRAVGRDPVRDQHRSDLGGDADEAFDLPIFPARERVLADVEVDTPRGQEATVERGAAE